MLAISACTTCSIQMIDTPWRLTSRTSSTSATHSCSVKTARDFVEQQHCRIGRQRPRQLEPLAIEQREARRRTVGRTGEPALFEDFHAALVGIVFALPSAERRGDDEDFRKRSCRRTAAESETSARCPWCSAAPVARG